MNIWERLFRMDLNMFKTRIHLNTMYEGYYREWKTFKIDNKKEWEIFQKYKDKKIENAWNFDILKELNNK